MNRNGIEISIGIILRTPGLFIIDYWWKYEPDKNIPLAVSNHNYFTNFVTNLALINGFLLLLLPLSFIRSLYTHFVCGALLLSAHLLSYYYVNISPSLNYADNSSEIVPTQILLTADDNEAISKQISLLGVHIIIAIVVSCLLKGPEKPILPILGCYSLPVLARIIDFGPDSIQLLHNFSSGLVVISLLRYAYYWIPGVVTSLKGAYSDFLNATQLQGTSHVLIGLLTKLFVPTHFLLFWSIAFLVKFYENIINGTSDEWYVGVLSAASAVCSSPISLLATAVAVTYMSYFALYAIKLYLWGSKTASISGSNAGPVNMHHNIHSGWEEGLTTLILALLTGLTEMKQPARMAVLTIILFVVLSSLLQSMLEIAEPVILSLSTFHGKNIIHHLKVLFLCTFLFLFPLHVTWVLAQVFPVDFWMAVVLSSSVLTSAQVLDLVIVHCLLWYDATRREPWEHLDEVVYYVRGATKIIEFIVAASVVVVGLYEGLTGHWSWTNALILLVHCYFNVWQRLQAGCRSFIKRCEAVKKSAKLPSATKEQLINHNDICAICFTEMMTENGSVLTPCNHFFHRVCLRKWLCFQDKCPICTASITTNQSSYNDEVSIQH